jgi:hypothetical protein
MPVRSIRVIRRGLESSAAFGELEGVGRPDKTCCFSWVLEDGSVLHLQTMSAGTRQAFIDYIKGINSTVVVEDGLYRDDVAERARAERRSVSGVAGSASPSSHRGHALNSPSGATGLSHANDEGQTVLNAYAWMLRSLCAGPSITPDQLLVLKAFRDSNDVSDEQHVLALKEANLDEETFEKLQIDKERASTCICCYDAPSTVVVLPCFHMCLCTGCEEAAGKDIVTCPICKVDVDKLQRVY